MKTEWVAGTRRSALARWQTNYVGELLQATAPDDCCRVTEKLINTEGDRRLDRALHTFGGKGAFTAELEAELLAGTIDFAVHSLKDLPTAMRSELVIGAIPPRASAGDVFVSADGRHLAELKPGERIGTSSLRRRAQLLAVYPHLRPVSIRGNVQTRLAKIESEDLAGVILARAGLERLRLEAHATEELQPPQWLPAAGQGALAVQCRADNDELLGLLARIHDEKTMQEVGAERAFLEALEGGCQVPLGASAVLEGKQLCLTGFIASLNGSKMVRGEVQGAAEDFRSLGRQLAEQLLLTGGQSIWTEVRAALGEG